VLKRGEEVPRTVPLLRNSCEHLFSIQRLPSEMARTVLRVYQTSSHEDFNSIFRHLEINAEIALNSSRVMCRSLDSTIYHMDQH
jgi:hypothetical protein